LTGTDVAAELGRQEIRQAVFSGDDRITEAVVTTPAALSGLWADVFDKVTATYRARHFAEQSKEIEALQEFTAVAIAAVGLARGDLQYGSGLQPQPLDNPFGARLSPMS
jgi:hypothetical protein